MSKLNAVVPTTVGVVTVVVVAVFLAVMGTATPARAATLCSSDYDSIQDAIEEADPGETVRIVSGTYTENLTISKNITVEGGWNSGCASRTQPDPQYTVIDGGAVGSVVSISGGSTATLDGLTLTNGQSDRGGGVYVSGSGTSPTLNNVVVTGNEVTYSSWMLGGGVCVATNNHITLTGCEITDNTGDGTGPCRGGGLALLGSATATLEATQIISNVCSSGSSRLGGGLYVESAAQVTFEGTENLIAYNEAVNGGGVAMFASNNLIGVVIRDNYASNVGGGIYVAGGSTYSGGKIANNYIVGNGKYSIFAWLNTIEIANNTIVGSFPLYDATDRGIYVAYTAGGPYTLTLTNNIVVSHTVGIMKHGDVPEASLVLVTNNVWGNSTNYGAGVSHPSDISADPLFVDPDNGDYHLTADSPCRYAGTTLDWLLVDYDGDQRGPLPFDIGADEYPVDYVSVFIPLVLKSYTP